MRSAPSAWWRRMCCLAESSGVPEDASVTLRFMFDKEQSALERKPARKARLAARGSNPLGSEDRTRGFNRSGSQQVGGTDNLPRLGFGHLAHRVHRFEARLHSPRDAVRLRLLVELTHFVPRDLQAYPGFFRYLLDDPAPRIRWEAARRLAYQMGPSHPLPQVQLEVPLHGVVDAESARSIADLRQRTMSTEGKPLAWGMEALGFLGDEPSAPLFEAHLNHKAPTMRLRAALASVRVGRMKPGLQALRNLASIAPLSRAPMVPVLAAEALVRAGEEGALTQLVVHTRALDWTSLGHGPEQILEDLTGVFRDGPDAWEDYLRRRGAWSLANKS